MSENTNDPNAAGQPVDIVQPPAAAPAAAHVEHEPGLAIKALNWWGWRLRLGGLAFMCAVFSAWFLRDGLVEYPKQKQMYEAYMALKDATDQPFSEAWPKLAAVHGWPATFTRESGPTPKTDTDIQVQIGMAGLSGLGALMFGVAFIRTFFRWIRLDSQGLSTNSGQRVDYANIKHIDKRRWHKGIAVVHGMDGTAITLDDWKFEQHPIQTILEELENGLRPEQLIGDASEKAKAAAANAPRPL